MITGWVQLPAKIVLSDLLQKQLLQHAASAIQDGSTTQARTCCVQAVSRAGMPISTTRPCARTATLDSVLSPQHQSVEPAIQAATKFPRVMAHVMHACQDFMQIKRDQPDAKSAPQDRLLVKRRPPARIVWVDAITTGLCLDTGRTIGQLPQLRRP
jgi:hypothetical protein